MADDAKHFYIRESLSEILDEYGIAVPSGTLDLITDDLCHSMDMWHESQSHQHVGGKSDEVVELKRKMEQMRKDHELRERSLQRFANRQLGRQIDKYVPVDGLGYVETRNL